MTRALRFVLVGAATGLVVLGVGSRALMRGVTLITGSTPILTFEGTADVLLTGAWYGTLGGFLLAMLPDRRPAWRPWLHWLLFLPGVILLSSASREEFGALAAQARPAAFAAFALLVLIYSLLLSALSRRVDRPAQVP